MTEQFKVPEGWQLVPIKPTQEMLDAGRWSGSGSVSVQEEWARKEVWGRMLANAPSFEPVDYDPREMGHGYFGG